MTYYQISDVFKSGIVEGGDDKLEETVVTK